MTIPNVHKSKLLTKINARQNLIKGIDLVLLLVMKPEKKMVAEKQSKRLLLI